MDDKFFEIRSLYDSEVPAIKRKIVTNPWLVDNLRKITFRNFWRGFNPLLNFIIKTYLRFKLSTVNSVKDFQQQVSVKAVRIIEKRTINSLTHSGLENLDKNEGYLFISNHRDITLDPGLLNYILDSADHEMAEIAFGDNLLMNDFIGDLIRINRAFIVKRNLPLREQLKESELLSEYICDRLGEHRSVWIAQREGRAKDGNDFTNPAVLKMLYLYHRKQKRSFNEYVKGIKIVPVSISYEYDPCDRVKGWELYRQSTRGKHIKRKYEDLISILAGIKKPKGRIHYNFGDVMRGDFGNEKDLAEKLDRAIIEGYRLWPSNYIAADLLENENRYSHKYNQKEFDNFTKRFNNMPEYVKDMVYESYARPVRNLEKLS